MKRYVPKWQLLTYLTLFISIAVISLGIAFNPPKRDTAYDCNDVRQRFINYAGSFTLDTYTNHTNNAAQDKTDAYTLVLRYPVCFPEGLIQDAMINIQK